jgi:ADP-ribose pyrophosphatase
MSLCGRGKSFPHILHRCGRTGADVAEIETLSTRLIYENRWMRVREDGIRHPDGSNGVFGVIEKPDFVVIVPMEDDGSLHLVEQYRYPVRQRMWEFPQGTKEGAEQSDPIDVARSELREETGLSAMRWTHLGHMFQAYGYATQGSHVFLASGLRPGDANLDHEEQGLVTKCFAFADVVRMIRSGEIKDAATIAAFSLLDLRGLLPEIPRLP